MRFFTHKRKPVFASRTLLLSLCASLAAALPALAADPGKLTVRVDQPAHRISPMLYGLMTEEINHSYDGGLYAEIVQDRTFTDYPKSSAHWLMFTQGAASGSLAFDKSDPLNAALPTSVCLNIAGNFPNGRIGIANDGFWGFPIKPNTTYVASFYAKASADFTAPLTVAIEPTLGAAPLASGTVPALTQKWQKYTIELKTGADATASIAKQFTIFARPGAQGKVWFNLVSLMPPTYHGTPNGNRIDLMQKLADLQPAFLRFPGGNYLEGNTIAERFNWKTTIGPLENRPGHMGPWSYRSSDGLGLLEFLRWCEDLKMDPVLAVFAGYALQGQVVTGDALKPHIQDALDEIEYVTGDASAKWGAQRVKDGHPAPFKLTYVEVGNEDGFDQSHAYDARFAPFYDAIKAKYPKLQIIATAPVSSRKPDVMDDHYYRSAVDMQNDVHHYDKTDRNGPKIFVGEWATTEGSPTPTMNAALGDAAWLTGMERNSDVIVMSCYAPLLVNVNQGASQWGTNLIGYDALKSFGSPSYYVQKMFNQNRGDVVLPVDLVSPPTPPTQIPLPHGGIGVATWSTDVDYTDLKVTTPDGKVLFQSDFSKNTDGWKFFNGQWKAENGDLHQTSSANECRAIAGDSTWGDYNYTLRARKNSGNEGFMAMFAVADSDNYIWWNVGGWNNTRTTLEIGERGARRTFGTDSQLGVETGKWYDLRVEVRGGKYTCFLDGKETSSGTYTPPPTPESFYATASRDDASGDVIVKVVNVSAQAQPMELTLQGATTISPNATIDTIAGEPGAVNTLADPEKVAPKHATIANAAAKFVQEFPAHSVSVLRFKTK